MADTKGAWSNVQQAWSSWDNKMRTDKLLGANTSAQVGTINSSKAPQCKGCRSALTL